MSMAVWAKSIPTQKKTSLHSYEETKQKEGEITWKKNGIIRELERRKEKQVGWVDIIKEVCINDYNYPNES